MSDPVTPLSPAQTAKQEGQAAKEGYLHKDAVAADIFVDELAGGPMDETISARASIDASKGKWFGKLMSRFLNLFQKNHGPKAQAGDLERAENEVKIEEQSGELNAPSQTK